MTASPAKIAILSPGVSSDFLGGVEIFNRQLQRALGNVEIFPDTETSLTSPSWNLERVGAEQAYRAYRVARSFLKRHRVHPFQLIISNGLYGWPLLIGHLDVPMVQVYHFTMAGLARQALLLRGDRLTTGMVSAFFDRLAGHGKQVIAVSNSVLREVERYYRHKGKVIPNAVDTELFRKLDKSRAREMLELQQEETIGLFVGRAEYAKGFDVLLEIARSMRDITFVVVGSRVHGPPNVKALGRIPHSDMPLCYASADFLLLPSRYEGFNLSILEALACDLPIVVSGAAYPFVDEPSRYGRVVGSLRPHEFVEAINALLDRSSSYACREAIVTGYSFEVFQDNWERLVTMLLEGDCTGAM